MCFKVGTDVTREFFSGSCFLESLLQNYTADFGLKSCWQSNSCSNCPFPGCRDHRQPNVISWDEVIENECYQEEQVLAELFEAKRQYEELRERMVREDPLIAEVFELKEGDGLSVKEIADRLGLTNRLVYYYLKKAMGIGRKYAEK